MQERSGGTFQYKECPETWCRGVELCFYLSLTYLMEMGGDYKMGTKISGERKRL